jgi:RNA polymerase sigma-70 factor (ECF subfamily)
MLLLIIDDQNIYLTDPDVGLMLEFQKGDHTSFEQLMDKHYKSVLNFIYRLVGNKETAEEITQEVFVKIYDQVHSYKPRSTFKTWMYIIAKNMSFNELRKGKFRYLDATIDETNVDTRADDRPEENSLQNEVIAAVQAAIQALPEKQRIATILRRYEDLSYQEIAAQLKISEKAVKSLLNRAKESLREKLARFVDSN